MKIIKIIIKILKKLKKWLNKDITCKYYVWYFYFILLVISFMIIKKYNPDTLYTYGVGEEIKYSNKCFKEEDGLYCIDKIKANWYELISK